MTIYACSDLHYGHCRKGDAAVRSLARHLLDIGRESDQLLVGGDIATCDATITSCLDLFSAFPGQRMAIAGNHDVWVLPEEQRNSWDRYERLPDLFRAAGFHPLEESPIEVNERVFVGSMGWYDYSFQDEIGIPIEEYRAKRSSRVGGMWGDAYYARLPCNDVAMTEIMVERLRTALEQVKDAAEVIVLTHHLPSKGLLFHPRCLVPKRWRYLNAFLGSRALGQVITRFSNVRHVVCGHIHAHKSIRENGIRMTSIGGGYQSKMLLCLDGDSLKTVTFRS